MKKVKAPSPAVEKTPADIVNAIVDHLATNKMVTLGEHRAALIAAFTEIKDERDRILASLKGLGTLIAGVDWTDPNTAWAPHDELTLVDTITEAWESARMAPALVKVRYRDHRGSLADSMATATTVFTKEELWAHVSPNLPDTVRFTDLSIDTYFDEPDLRIGWDKTYLVAVHGYGVVGMTDGPL